MKYLKTYESHSQIKHKKLYSDILALLGYYSTNDESLIKFADDIYDKYNNDFDNTVVNHSKDYYLPDDSPRLVYHASNVDFDKFNTPAFFGDADSAYSADILYCCVMNYTQTKDLCVSRFIDFSNENASPCFCLKSVVQSLNQTNILLN